MSHIALLMMVKNESKRILVSLKSVIGVVKTVIIYDTGSTDNTPNIIKKFCKKNKLHFHLKEGEFVDFSTSRNVSLDFADTFPEVDYLLLLDSNDELRNGQLLLEAAQKYRNNNEITSFLVCQEWEYGSITKYYNVRFIKPRRGWRYKGSVHEYIETTDESNNCQVKLDPSIVLYQDRKEDAEKSISRYAQDKKFLLKDYEQNPKDGRTLFYLAQTCGCLGEYQESFKYYKERSLVGGFEEEVFHSLLRMGEISSNMLKSPWSESLEYYLLAFEMSKRAEPLVRITNYYKNQNMWQLAFLFGKKATEMEYPTESILFVDKKLYDYDRWHLLGIVAFYVGKYKEGYEGCLRALMHPHNPDIDKFNLKFYEEKLGIHKTKTN